MLLVNNKLCLSLKEMVEKRKFDEARQFALKYNLSTSVSFLFIIPNRSFYLYNEGILVKSQLITKFEFTACLEALLEKAAQFDSPLDEEEIDRFISECNSKCERAVELLKNLTVRFLRFTLARDLRLA